METPKPRDERGADEPSRPGPPPPAPSGPQAPVGAPPPPPAGPPAPWGAPESPPSYGGGPVPPGGWERPIVQQRPGWLGRPLASWGIRAAALLIDWLILIIPVAFLVAIVIGIAAGSDAGAAATFVLGFLVYLVVALVYAPVLMARSGRGNGQTWGKQALGIRVVRDDGRPMSFGWAALRELVVKGILFGWIGSTFFAIPLLLDYLWPLWDDQNRALHDMIVSTHVVRG